MISLPKHPSFWSFWPNRKHHDYMRVYGDNAKHAWSGKRLYEYDSLTDMEIEASLRIHVYEQWNWTGTQDPGLPSDFVDSPIDLLQYQEAHKSDNGGKGPTWSCGPYSSAYVGLLAAYGIPARRVWNSRMSDGQVDYAVEFYDRDAQRWKFVIPQLCMHTTCAGIHLELFRWAQLDRMGSTYTSVTLSGTGKPWFTDDFLNINGYRGMSGNPHVAPGNNPHAGGNSDTTKARWKNFQIMPKIGNASEFPHDSNMPKPWAHGTFDLNHILVAPQL